MLPHCVLSPCMRSAAKELRCKQLCNVCIRLLIHICTCHSMLSDPCVLSQTFFIYFLCCFSKWLCKLCKYGWHQVTTHLSFPEAWFDCFHRPNFWYWESVVLVQTLGLAAAQVFATSLDAFFQLTIMIVILMVGSLALAHFHPFDQEGPQTIQVCCFCIACAKFCITLLA